MNFLQCNLLITPGNLNIFLLYIALYRSRQLGQPLGFKQARQGPDMG